MSRFEDLTKHTDFNDSESIARALIDIQRVTDFDLIHWVVMGETLNKTARETRQKIALARAEKERRDNLRSERLSKKITVTSARIAATATIFGAVLGAGATLTIGYLERHQVGASDHSSADVAAEDEVGLEESK